MTMALIFEKTATALACRIATIPDHVAETAYQLDVIITAIVFAAWAGALRMLSEIVADRDGTVPVMSGGVTIVLIVVSCLVAAQYRTDPRGPDDDGDGGGGEGAPLRRGR